MSNKHSSRHHGGGSSSSGGKKRASTLLLPVTAPAGGAPRAAFVDVPAVAYGPHEPAMRQRFRACLWQALALELLIVAWGGGGFVLVSSYGGVGWTTLVHAALGGAAALALLNILVGGAMPAHIYTLYGVRQTNPVRAVAAGSQSLAVALTIAYVHLWVSVPVLFVTDAVLFATAPSTRAVQWAAAGADVAVLGALLLVRYLEYERAARRNTIAAYRRITTPVSAHHR